MEKVKFCKRFSLIMAFVPTVILLLVALFGGFKVIEANLFEEVAKWAFMDLVITAVWTLFVGVFSPLVWHIIYDNKPKK